MQEDKQIIHRSLRFFPHWNDNDIYQVVGLIRMINFIFEKNPKAEYWLEIGSFIGESASIFLAYENVKRLDCVDAYIKSELKQKLHKEINNSRCFLHNCNSVNFSNKIEDKSVDVVYIDADHSYESVKKDIEIYYPKIKQNGFICGHDYSEPWPGVVQAVDEFIRKKELKLKTFEDASWIAY